MITRTFTQRFLRIKLVTNDKRVAALWENAAEFESCAEAPPVSISFHIFFDEKPASDDALYTYAHAKTKLGRRVTLLRGPLASVSVDETKKMVTGKIYDLNAVQQPRLRQTLFMDPVIQILSAQRYHFLHSALLVKEDKGVLISGPSGSGKSSFALMLALQGYSLLTDDKCLFKKRGSRYTFLAVRQRIGVQPHLLKRFPELKKYPLEKDYDQKRKRIASEVFAQNADFRRPFTPRAMIFPEFSRAGNLRIKKISAQEALARILSDANNTYNSGRDKKSAGTNFFALHEFTSRIPAYRVFYNDHELKKIPQKLGALLQ